MVEFKEPDATFPRPGDTGREGRQFLRLKTTQLSRPSGMDFINKPARSCRRMNRESIPLYAYRCF